VTEPIISPARCEIREQEPLAAPTLLLRIIEQAKADQRGMNRHHAHGIAVLELTRRPTVDVEHRNTVLHSEVLKTQLADLLLPQAAEDRNQREPEALIPYDQRPWRGATSG
jgi:hypothetical protein